MPKARDRVEAGIALVDDSTVLETAFDEEEEEEGLRGAALHAVAHAL